VSTLSEAELLAVAGEVPDPELPMLTVADLGILRGLVLGDDGSVEVTITPTYIGCPATAVIRQSVAAALRARGVREVSVRTVLLPAWSSDWISAAGRDKLAAAGIAPPGGCACPRCASADSEEVSAFGPTPCTALRRCVQCLEPFEAIKLL
jgi:ring-1,2-phenylacetyl-CoA epoxidase subunit PaaD